MITTEQVMTALSEVIDPEIGLNVVDLGMIRDASIDGAKVRVAMTLTTPACPLGSYLTSAAEDAIRRRIPEAQDVQVALVHDRPWSPEMMSEAAKRQLGWM